MALEKIDTGYSAPHNRIGFDEFVKSTLFEDIIREKVSNLNIAFVCFYGSRNYNIHSDKSDYDFFIVYYPSFDNFYDSKFQRFSVIKKDYDYFITPIHEYVRHAMKGNIKFIEPIMCGSIFFIKSSEAGFSAIKVKHNTLVDKLGRFISVNYKKNFNAMLGIVNNKRLNVFKGLYTSNTLKYKTTHGYDIKEAINSLRILFLLENYIKSSGQFSFVVKDNPLYKKFEDYMFKINERAMSKDTYLEIFDKKINDVLKLNEELDVLYENQKQVITRTEGEIKNYVKKLCTNNICFAKQA